MHEHGESAWQAIVGNRPAMVAEPFAHLASLMACAEPGCLSVP